MKTRTLGRTGLEVGVIGLGTEYLNGTPGNTYTSVVHRAVDAGVNYVDIVYSFPEYLDNLGAALRGKRGKVLITGHLGSAETDGQYRRSRDVAECESLFHDLLARVGTDHVDIAFLSNCDQEDDYRRMTRPGGLLELALRFQQEGKARFIAFSGHQPRVSLKAVQSGRIDVLMHSINIQGAATPGRKDLFLECAARDVGLVGMKPFAGGSLLGHRGKKALTPVQCLNYALSQPGVATVVPGVSNPEELRQALAYLEATDEEKDFSAVLPEFQEVEEGTCVYCNHCLPCPVGINIGETIRALVTAERGGLEAARAAYARLPVKASECIECEECVERCPFSVNILPLVHHARGIFEAMGQ
jgi:predicted aldo/keto reductase-like oxidoreductase